MIVAIWKPKYRVSRKRRSKYIDYWYLVDLSQLSERKNKDLKVVYKCDICGTISNAISHRLLSKDAKYNTPEKQFCINCRSKLKEKEKNAINFKTVKESLEKEDYILLTRKEEFNFYEYPSQTKIKVKCPRGHILYITWNNFSRGKRCRECYSKKRKENAINNKEGIESYRSSVIMFTEENFKKYKNELEKEYKRGKEFHLDHKFSVAEGFRNNIPPYIIGSYTNLEILSSKENINKRDGCSISKEELFINYFMEEK